MFLFILDLDIKQISLVLLVLAFIVGSKKIKIRNLVVPITVASDTFIEHNKY